MRTPTPNAPTNQRAYERESGAVKTPTDLVQPPFWGENSEMTVIAPGTAAHGGVCCPADKKEVARHKTTRDTRWHSKLHVEAATTEQVNGAASWCDGGKATAKGDNCACHVVQ